MMKFSYISQLEGYGLRYKNPGASTEALIKLHSFLDESGAGKKNPLNANIPAKQRL